MKSGVARSRGRIEAFQISMASQLKVQQGISLDEQTVMKGRRSFLERIVSLR